MAPETSPAEPRPFKPLGEYDWPPMPKEETARLVVERVKKIFRKGEDKAYIAEAQLKRTVVDRLDEVVSPPACGPLLAELDREISGWLSDPDPLLHTKLIILPPGDRSGTIGDWAHKNGYETLPPPSRASLASPWPDDDPIDLGRENARDLLVVPRLERWFLRHQHGLTAVRRLIKSIHETDRRTLIGCDSWGWAFLVRAIGADLALSEPLTFQPFGAGRLRQWFAGLAATSGIEKVTFRLSRTGEDVLATGTGCNGGSGESDYLAKLASRSLGIPWIAWHLWREDLRSDLSQEEKQNGNSGVEEIPRSDENTLWIVGPKDLTLPPDHTQTALLTLHALLIHGGLTSGELRTVLPVVGENFIVAGLIKCGFVERDGDILYCSPTAYPNVRTKLFTDGFPVDSL